MFILCYAVSVSMSFALSLFYMLLFVIWQCQNRFGSSYTEHAELRKEQVCAVCLYVNIQCLQYTT